MKDKELEKYIKTIDGKFEKHNEKDTVEMSNKYYNLLEERISGLTNDNSQLSEKLEKQIKQRNEWIELVKKYKEVNDEAREYIYKNAWLSNLEEFNSLTDVEVKQLVQILDKTNEGNNE